MVCLLSPDYNRSSWPGLREWSVLFLAGRFGSHPFALARCFAWLGSRDLCSCKPLLLEIGVCFRLVCDQLRQVLGAATLFADPFLVTVRLLARMCKACFPLLLTAQSAVVILKLEFELVVVLSILLVIDGPVIILMNDFILGLVTADIRRNRGCQSVLFFEPLFPRHTLESAGLLVSDLPMVDYVVCSSVTSDQVSEELLSLERFLCLCGDDFLLLRFLNLNFLGFSCRWCRCWSFSCTCSSFLQVIWITGCASLEEVIRDVLVVLAGPHVLLPL